MYWLVVGSKTTHRWPQNIINIRWPYPNIIHHWFLTLTEAHSKIDPILALYVVAISIKLCNYSWMCELYHSFSCIYSSRQTLLWSFDVWEKSGAHRVQLVTWLRIFLYNGFLILFYFDNAHSAILTSLFSNYHLSCT